jgi:acyl-CoA carboxylase subunit beta
MGVCLDCGHHLRLTAQQRVAQLFDDGTAELLGGSAGYGDPLRFTDSKPYPERLRAARAATGLDEAVLCARGTIHGHPVIAAVMDFRFLGGSMGGATGNLITAATDTALAERVPFLIVTASGGARMQEGAISLMQMANVSAAMGRLDAAGILTISLITDPTFGGVAASIATLADVIISEPGARMGFAGPRVIEQTIKRPVPKGLQAAENLLRNGLLDAVYQRAALRPALARLLTVAKTARPAPPGDTDAPELVTDADSLPATDPWQAVRNARDIRRPTALDYFDVLLDGFEELHGDRIGGDCASIVGGVGRLAGRPVVVIAHQKGHDPAELMARNFGMAMPSGYRKAARLMRLAAKLGLPLVTLVDTPGAYPGIEAEEGGQAVAIAESLRLLSGLPVPVVSVIIGEGGSGGALAIAVADRVLALSGAIYSVISPEGCAAILWHDAAAAPLAAAALRLHARDLLQMSIVDAVIPEPDGGAHLHPAVTAGRLRAAVAKVLQELTAQAPPELVARRQQRFREFAAADQRVGV